MFRDSRFLAKAAFGAVFVFTFSLLGLAQTPGRAKTENAPVPKSPLAMPKVTQIDIEGLKALLKPTGRPMLMNFWATWCDPCREEFPDLVRLHTAYQGRVDFITISLDDLAEINTSVPKFLGEMKAEMPAYLLKTLDESAAITMVSNDWQGNLPLTILFNSDGERAYSRNGRIKYEAVNAEIEKALAPSRTANRICSIQ